MFTKKFWFSLLATILFVVAIMIIGSMNSGNKKTQNPSTVPITTPTPYYKAGSQNSTTEKIYSLQKTIINSTQDSQIKNLPDIIKTETLTNGERKYSLNSPVPISRPNLILTKNGVSIFERTITNETDPNSKDYIAISQYQSIFGDPDKVIKRSKYYGDFMNTYIYASRGFALIGNPNTDEVYEVQAFVPMSTDQYVQQYGQDLDLNPVPKGP